MAENLETSTIVEKRKKFRLEGGESEHVDHGHDAAKSQKHDAVEANKVPKPRTKAKLGVQDNSAEIIVPRTESPPRYLKNRGKCGPPPPSPTKEQRKHTVDNADAQSIRFATKALTYYRQQGHPRYDLVKAWYTQARITAKYIIFHMNFKAMPRKDPDAPSELFFAELLLGKKLQVSRCCSLGRPPDSDSDKDDNLEGKECQFCTLVYHPSDKKFEGAIVR